MYWLFTLRVENLSARGRSTCDLPFLADLINDEIHFALMNINGTGVVDSKRTFELSLTKIWEPTLKLSKSEIALFRPVVKVIWTKRRSALTVWGNQVDFLRLNSILIFTFGKYQYHCKQMQDNLQRDNSSHEGVPREQWYGQLEPILHQLFIILNNELYS